MIFRERLLVPALWWVLAAGFAASLVLAFGLYLGPWWGAGMGLAAFAVAAAIFATAAVSLTVDQSALRVGRAVLERGFIASVLPLDAEATTLRAGVDADARAHLVLRPYVSTAVEIVLDDPDDPVPYWLVSTRRPRALAAALTTAAAP